MDEWWTYRPSDLLLFSRETYYGLFELYHASVWPAHLALVLASAAPLVLLRGDARWRVRLAAATLALQWLWVAVAFHLAHFITINPFATYFGWAFLAQAALLLLMGMPPGVMSVPRAWGFRERGAAALVLFALLAVPLLGLLAGRSWRQIEIPGMTPDPTAIATLGIVILTATRARIFWLALPIAWCLVGGVMLWTLGSVEAVAPLGAAALAAVLLLIGNRSHRRHGPDHG